MDRGWGLKRRDSHWSRHLCSLLVLATVLGTCSRAQDEDTRPTVNIRMATDRLRTTAILPARLRSEGAIFIIGNETLRVESSTPSNVTSSFECESSNCTVTLKSVSEFSMVADPEVVTLEFTSGQTLVLTFRESLTDSCTEYNVPRLFLSTAEAMMAAEPFEFRCDPLENDTDVEQVVWRRFDRLAQVEMFLSMRQDFNESIIESGGNFRLSGPKNSQLSVTRDSSSEFGDLVAYFVPSFRMEGGGEERVTAETLIFYGPQITTPRQEFSIDINFDSEESRNFTMIACEADTFPPTASTSWVLENTEFTRGVGLREYPGFGTTVFLRDSGFVSMNSSVEDGIVEMIDPTYDDDGLFTCTVDNGVNEVTQSVRLRIKSRLRPLWPALGIIGVVLMVSLFMFSFFTAEKIIEKKKRHRYVEGSSNHSGTHRLSSTSSSSGQNNNNKGKKHTAIKRISSTKPLIEESTI